MAVSITHLQVGCDVDWCKTAPGRKLYHKARSRGTLFPNLFNERGFDHVRIRVRDYDLLSINPDTNLSLLEEIAVVADDCLMGGLIPIVAFQAEDFKFNPTQEEIGRVTQWWELVATRLKGFSTWLDYNLIIETTGAIKNDNAALNFLYSQVYLKIQAIDPRRTCAVCPNSISSPERLPELLVPGENCFVESHFNAAGFSKTNPAKLWTTGTDAEKKLILDKIDLIVQWKEKTGFPVWVGAILFGSSEDTEIEQYSVAERVAIAQFVCGQLKAKGIPFAVNSDTKFFDSISASWIEEVRSLVDAIIF